jgi:hypothetical protein
LCSDQLYVAASYECFGVSGEPPDSDDIPTCGVMRSDQAIKLTHDANVNLLVAPLFALDEEGLTVLFGDCIDAAVCAIGREFHSMSAALEAGAYQLFEFSPAQLLQCARPSVSRRMLKQMMALLLVIPGKRSANEQGQWREILQIQACGMGDDVRHCPAKRVSAFKFWDLQL